MVATWRAGVLGSAYRQACGSARAASMRLAAYGAKRCLDMIEVFMYIIIIEILAGYLKTAPRIWYYDKYSAKKGGRGYSPPLLSCILASGLASGSRRQFRCRL